MKASIVKRIKQAMPSHLLISMKPAVSITYYHSLMALKKGYQSQQKINKKNYQKVPHIILPFQS